MTFSGLMVYRVTVDGDQSTSDTVAVLAKEHAIPFYVAAPFSTISRTQ